MEGISDPLLKELCDNGIPFTVYPDHIELPDFYKSGTAELWWSGGWSLKTRYDTWTIIQTFEDIVQVNYDWWGWSKNRAVFWEDPSHIWIKSFDKFGFDYKEQ